MCGIAGYVGPDDALPVLLNALHRVEYRGYDSCGVAIHDGSRRIEVAKAVGYVDDLRDATGPIPGGAGIGHTRWATVGSPSKLNAHPHLDCTGRVAVVHNGSVENHYQLREELRQRGHRFRSETDTEVLAHLLEEHGSTPDGVAEALARVQGPYAIAVLFEGVDSIIAARRGSPIIIGLGDGENMVGSDVPAVLERANGFVHLEDGDIATVSASGVEIRHRGEAVRRRVHHVRWGPEVVDKGGYEHFLLKEVHEQPQVLRDTLSGRISADGHVDLGLGLDRRPPPEELFLLGCGSASHAAMVGEAFLSALSDTRVQALEASEMVRPKRRGPGAWSVLVSQSGETADTVDAARDARRAGHFTLALTNVPESSITRVAHATHHLRAGQEVSVASTKTYLAQLVGLYLLGLELYPPADRRRRQMAAALRRLPEAVQQALAMAPQLEILGTRLAAAEHAFIIGKGINYPTALEGAWKFKEVAYLHAEGFASGELKHGPFALLDANTPVIAIMPRDDTYERMLVAVEEIHARGAPIIALTDCDNAELQSIAQSVVCLPPTDPMFTPVVSTAALQLMVYYCGLARGCPIDRPRNLAKSVTVH
ncbi:MAG: glutamine--fructose-6-phosphate transaminase (isomerizing) [Chloroflexota bacterium]|nr:glutamine--fructose-6-phosphate transaminase (isomerizing) [Chloroflexota bacterium]